MSVFVEKFLNFSFSTMTHLHSESKCKVFVYCEFLCKVISTKFAHLQQPHNGIVSSLHTVAVILVMMWAWTTVSQCLQNYPNVDLKLFDLFAVGTCQSDIQYEFLD